MSKFNNNNKFAQNNLEKGPRRGAVAYVRRKVPIGYNGPPQIRPQKYPFPWTDFQTALPDAIASEALEDRSRQLDKKQKRKDEF